MSTSPSFAFPNPLPGAEPRYNSDMLRQVAALAARLQHEKDDTLTVREMEAIGAEVGVDPVFMREALAQLAPAPAPVVAPAVAVPAVPAGEVQEAPQSWAARLFPFGIPVWWSILAGVATAGSQTEAWPILFYFIWPVPLAVYLGYLGRTKKKAGLLACELMFLLALSIVASAGTGFGPDGARFVMLYWLASTPLAAGAASLGAALRRRLTRRSGQPQAGTPLPAAPPSAVASVPSVPAGEPLSRPAMLQLLFSLQSHLEAQKQHRAFLSVDVVGSTQMKHRGSDLAVEHCFGQFRRWAEEVVWRLGGRMHSAAGDGMMAAFAEDAAALRAARELLDGLERFNRDHNRLPDPFRIRCGVSAGRVALEDDRGLGYVHSAVIDRAAALQRRAEPGDVVVGGELTSAALLELGALAPLPEPVEGEPAFSWLRARSGA